MSAGRYGPGPLRAGNVRNRPIEIQERGLLDVLGTAITKDPTSNVALVIHAAARALTEGDEDNQRLAMQSDPDRMTTFLPRWETVLGLRPAPDATEVERREVVRRRMTLIAKRPHGTGLMDMVGSIVGEDVFLNLAHQSPMPADQTPDGYVSLHMQASSLNVGGGPVDLREDGQGGPLVYGDLLWYASTQYVQIRTELPGGMTEVEYGDRVRQLDRELDEFMPAWTAFAWTRSDGFQLDTEMELDYAALDDGTPWPDIEGGGIIIED